MYEQCRDVYYKQLRVKWKKGLETTEAHISEILQSVAERQRNRLSVFKVYTISTTNYTALLLAYCLCAHASIHSFHYIYFINIPPVHFLKSSFHQW